MNKLWSTELKVDDIQVLDKSGDEGGEYNTVSKITFARFHVISPWFQTHSQRIGVHKGVDIMPSCMIL